MLACSTEERQKLDKEVFNKRDIEGARHTDAMHIRMPRRLVMFIKTLAMVEGSDSSEVARRFLTIQAVEEGYDADGC